jgi:hypothetical protein
MVHRLIVIEPGPAHNGHSSDNGEYNVNEGCRKLKSIKVSKQKSRDFKQGSKRIERSTASHTTTPCSGDNGNETVNSRPVKFEIRPRMSKVSIIQPMENSI